MVTIAGLAALSWEVLWQLKSSLSLGVSAVGTAEEPMRFNNEAQGQAT